MLRVAFPCVERARFVRVLCECAAVVLPLLRNDQGRSENLLRVCREWADRRATVDEVRNARALTTPFDEDLLPPEDAVVQAVDGITGLIYPVTLFPEPAATAYAAADAAWGEALRSAD